MNWEFIIKYLPMYERAALLTVKLGLSGVICAIIVGLICAIIQYEKVPVARQIVAVYIELSRNTPLLVQLFFIYYGLPKIGIQTDPQTCGIAGLTFLGGSYMAEVQTYWYIIIPQTLRRLIPLSINLITRMIKTTSLILMIGVVEVLKVSQQIIEANRMSSPNAAFGIYLVVFLLYFFACWPISMLAKYLEKRWR